MKKLFVVAALLVLSVVPAHAETVETCTTTSNGYGSGSVCGAYTVKEHVVVETAIDTKEMTKILLSIVGVAVITTALYKVTYKSYILG